MARKPLSTSVGGGLERTQADVILSTTEIPPEFEKVATVINGISLITGIGQAETLQNLARALQDNP